jgi:hypothetical protein
MKDNKKVMDIGVWGKTSTLQGKMILLIFVILVPVFAMLSYSTFELRNQKIADTQLIVSDILKTELIDLERLAEGSRYLLATLAEDPTVKSLDPVATSAIFAKLLESTPLHANIFALNPNGDIYASAVPQKVSVNSADLPYFVDVVKNRSFSFGDFRIGRIVARPVIVSAYPVLDSNGQLIAVVAASLDLEKINLGLEENNLLKGGELTVIDKAGHVLLHYPDPDKTWVGKTISDQGLLNSFFSSGNGEKVIKDSQGVEKIYSFAPVESSNGKIFAGFAISKQGIFNDINSRFYFSLACILLILLLSIIVASYFGKLAKKGGRKAI